MSMELFIDAIGKIDEELIDEYYSYNSTKKIKLYYAMKIMAASFAAIICIGAAVNWIRNDKGTQPENNPIVAIKESESPQKTDMPQPTQTIETINPDILAQASHSPDNESSNSESNGNNQQSQTNIFETEVPDNRIVWNQVGNMWNPCGNIIAEVDKSYEDHLKNSEENDGNDSAVLKPLRDNWPKWEKNDPRWQGWISNILYYAPPKEGWYWFNTRYLWHGRSWTNSYVLQTDRNQSGAYSNTIITGYDAKLYVMQVVTDAKSLEEANDLYPEDAFSGNLQVSYWNGIPMYLVSNSGNEYYVRMLVEDTLITIVDKGFGIELIEELLQNVKKIPVLEKSDESSTDESLLGRGDNMELPEDYLDRNPAHRIDYRIYDVQNWIPSVGIWDNDTYYTDFTPLYRSFEYNGEGHSFSWIYKNKVDLYNEINYLNLNDEIIEYVENMPDSVFDNYYVLLTSDYVHADNLDSVKINKIGYNLSNKQPKILIDLSDDGGDIIVYNRQSEYDNESIIDKRKCYLELTLISKHYLPEEERIDDIVLNHQVIGGSKIIARAYSYCDEFLEEGTYVVDTVEQWKKLRLLMREELNVDESFFNHSAFILHVSYVNHHSRYNQQIDVTYSLDSNNICFRIDKRNYLYRNNNLTSAYLNVIIDILQVNKSLIAERNIVVNSSFEEIYYDYRPEQTVYAIEEKEGYQ